MDAGVEAMILHGHTAPASAVRFSPDGSRLASVSEDGTARIWDVRDGSEALALQGNGNRLRSVEWSLDGTRLAAGDQYGNILAWSATSAFRRECSPRLLAWLDRRIARDPTAASDLALRGAVLARLGAWDRSAADFDAAGRARPKGPQWFQPGWWFIPIAAADRPTSAPSPSILARFEATATLPPAEPGPSGPALARGGDGPQRLPGTVRDTRGLVRDADLLPSRAGRDPAGRRGAAEALAEWHLDRHRAGACRTGGSFQSQRQK